MEASSYTACGSLLCGERSCYKLNQNFTFSKSGVILDKRRSDHLCWTMENSSVLLLGGGGAGTPFTTELVESDGSSSSPSFKLINPT